MGEVVGKEKILILENAIDVTGGLKSILNSSVALRSKFEFILVLPTNSRCIGYAKSFNVQVIELPFRELSKNIFSWIFYIPTLLLNTIRLNRLVDQLKIDLIIANDFYNLLPGSYRLFGGTVHYVCYVRFLPNRFPKILVKAWSTIHRKYAAKIIAVSEAVKSQLVQDEKIQVVHEGLPPITGASPGKTIDPSLTLLYMSNFIEGKGQQYALQSFEPLAKKYPAWRLRFVGGDMGLEKNVHYKNSLKRLAEELKIQNQIEWSEFKENVQLEYLSASIVLNFSNSESFSLTCLEAMAAGRPVIATASGGPVEIIDTMENGMLVPVGDISAMTQAMDYLMANSEIRLRMGMEAFNHVQSKFSNSNTYDKLRKIYETSINRVN
jgi:glycosyltransferase involved in cell wall biosynthesis